MMRGFVALLRHDLALGWRERADLMPVLGFFVVVALLVPLAVGPEPNLLARIAAGMLWLAALLAVLLALDRLFADDWRDGTLDLLLLSPLPLPLAVLAKVTAHWLLSTAPLVVLAPLLAVLLRLPEVAWPALLGGLLVGTPALSLIGAVGAALTLGARRGGVLLALLVLPLYVPVLVFGAAAVEAALAGTGAAPHLMLLGAIFLAALALAPWAAGAALRLAVE